MSLNIEAALRAIQEALDTIQKQNDNINIYDELLALENAFRDGEPCPDCNFFSRFCPMCRRDRSNTAEKTP
jgi:hypothetical protein